jgi:hypothetical protein
MFCGKEGKKRQQLGRENKENEMREIIHRMNAKDERNSHFFFSHNSTGTLLVGSLLRCGFPFRTGVVCRPCVFLANSPASENKQKMSQQENDGMEVTTDGATVAIVEEEEVLIDELELEYNDLNNQGKNENCESLITGYQQILNNSRNDDNAIKIKEKAIYG